MKQKNSESIFQKRIKRFRSMKRGYYSLITLIIFYILSLLGPLWMDIFTQGRPTQKRTR